MFTVRALMALALVACATVPNTSEAGTFYPLMTPDNAVAYPGFPSSHGCGADTFNADDTANGFCYHGKSTACSGRGCQPVQYIDYLSVAWNTDGSVAISLPCGSVRHHNPQPDQWTYLAGFGAANCHGPAVSSSTTVQIDQYLYYYFATSNDGLFELVRNQSGPFIYGF